MTEETRGDQRRQRRERMEQRQREIAVAAGRRAMMNRVRMGALLAVVLVAVGLLVFWLVREATAPLPGEVLVDEGRTHVANGEVINHSSYPPASGPHFSNWSEWRFTEGSLDPGNWVHNLEHGGVVILYQCPQDCKNLKDNLKALFDKAKKSKYGYQKLVIARDDKIDTQLAMMAWDRREKLTEFDEARMLAFYNAFVDRGPEDAP